MSEHGTDGSADPTGGERPTGGRSGAGDWLQLRGFTKWIALAAVIGVLGGVAASAFTVLVDAATEHGFGRVAGTTEGGVLRTANPLLVLALPTLGGLLVCSLAHKALTVLLRRERHSEFHERCDAPRVSLSSASSSLAT